MSTIFLIATNKYRGFLHQAVQSIKNHWENIQIIIFTDNPLKSLAYEQYKIDHYPWPYTTLLRFHYFLMVEVRIKGDYVYYMDVDARWVDKPEVKGDLVGTRHCGFYFPEHSKGLPIEKNPKSVFYGIEFKKYYGGGFFGGRKDEFLKLSKWCRDHIEKDLKNEIIPVHNDETAMNAYFYHNPPTLELSPDYHFPEDYKDYIMDHCWGGKNPFNPKLLLLKKDHDSIRN